MVNDGSADRTAEIAKQYTEKVYSHELKGIGYSWQFGAEQTTQEYIVYIDSDRMLTDNALDTLLAELKASDCVNLGALPLRPTGVCNCWQRAIQKYADLIGLLGQRAVHTAYCSIGILRRDTILKYRFDPLFFRCADADLSLRLTRDGYQIGLSSAITYGHYRADLRTIIQVQYSNVRARALLACKHGLLKTRLLPQLAFDYICVQSIIKRKSSGLIPFLIVVGIMQTVGMVTGLFDVRGFVRVHRGR
jgi:glycosyltransferase involved in cell wall biosynthesis